MPVRRALAQEVSRQARGHGRGREDGAHMFRIDAPACMGRCRW